MKYAAAITLILSFFVPSTSAADWRQIPKSVRASANPAIDLPFDLPSAPANGVIFSFKLLHAPNSGPQMAVFSNGAMAGLIQLWGTGDTPSPYRWQKTYRLYIPPQMLVAGKNALRIEAVRPLWSDKSVDERIWWEWDELKLETPDQPALEPIHGKVSYLGTTITRSAAKFADVDDDTLRIAPYMFKWMGIAYSGNTIRAHFWHDCARLQPRRLEYLKLLADMNLTACADNVSGSHYKNDASGNIPQRMKDAIDDFFSRYGQYIQYYELGNEPCMFGGGYAEYLQEARYISGIKPSHVKLTAVGWAYGGGKGTPVNWDTDVALRRKLESYCQATNGHSYGYSYGDAHGGSFLETLNTYQGVEDGWPKEFVNSETGTNDWHSEQNGTHFATTQPHAQAFDRILRAHVAVVDRTMQHAVIFEDFSLFNAPVSWNDPTTLSAFPGVKGEDTRLKTYRRLALAYATHGAPLPYAITNLGDITGKKVYFRAVNTAAIPAQPGSGATSNKILLNFVNFEPTAQTLKVQVTLPAPGEYAAERFGPGATYQAAHSALQLKASPALDLVESLGPGDSVQYILTPPAVAAPYAPTAVNAAPANASAVITWRGAAGATSYTIKRGVSQAGPFTAIASVAQATTFTDAALTNGSTQWYVVSASNEAGVSADSTATSVIVGTPLAPANVNASNGDQSVTLSWKPVDRAKTYRVLRSAGKAPAQTIAEIAETTYIDRGLTNDSIYHYAVIAVNEFGPSIPSTTIAATPQAPPEAPADLSAYAGDHRVVLRWKALRDAMAYNVKRAPAADDPWQVVADQAAGNEFVDDTVENGKTYYYVVSGFRVGPEGANSAAVSAAPAAEALPAPWQQCDIGPAGRHGAATFVPASGTFTVQGAGNDVWGKADEMHLVHQPLSGDGTIVARVVAFDNTHPAARMGLVIRQNLQAGAAMVMVHDNPFASGVTSRATADAECTHSGGPFRPWIKLTRRGDAFTGYISEDGVKWQQIGSRQVPMTAQTVVGLAVCSHNRGQLNKVFFDHVTLTVP